MGSAAVSPWVVMTFDLLVVLALVVLRFGRPWHPPARPAARLVGGTAAVTAIAGVVLVAWFGSWAVAWAEFKNRPLAIDPDAISVGECRAGEPAEATVTFTNLTREPIQVIVVQSDCSCVTADVPAWVGAGESRQVRVAVRPAARGRPVRPEGRLVDDGRPLVGRDSRRGGEFQSLNLRRCAMGSRAGSQRGAVYLGSVAAALLLFGGTALADGCTSYCYSCTSYCPQQVVQYGAWWKDTDGNWYYWPAFGWGVCYPGTACFQQVQYICTQKCNACMAAGGCFPGGNAGDPGTYLSCSSASCSFDTGNANGGTECTLCTDFCWCAAGYQCRDTRLGNDGGVLSTQNSACQCPGSS
jgi:hypothetical protein